MARKHSPTILTVNGVRFVVIAESDYLKLTSGVQTGGAELPPADAEGTFPARETIRTLIANKLRQKRLAIGLSQAQLGDLAGVRTETINRLESAKHAPHAATIKKIEDAIERAGNQGRPRRAARG